MRLEDVYTGERAATYHVRRSATALWQREQDVISKVMKRYLRSGDRVIDIAAGTGRWLDVYAELHVKPILLDVSQDMLRIAIARAAEIGIAADFERMDLLANFRLPTGDLAVATRFFNWIDIENVSCVLRAGIDAGIERFLFSVVTLDREVRLARRLRAKSRILLKNLRTALGLTHRGRYYLHSGSDLERLFEDLELRIVAEEVIPHRRDETYKVIVLSRNSGAGRKAASAQQSD